MMDAEIQKIVDDIANSAYILRKAIADDQPYICRQCGTIPYRVDVKENE